MNKRFCIQPKDISLIMGRTERWSEDRIKTIKAALGKENSQFVTIKEFCEYEGFKEEEIRIFLGITN